jgi:hypothetical protein
LLSGHLAILEALVDELRIFDIQMLVRRDYLRNHSRYVAHYGHEDILRYLFKKGAERDSTIMLVTAFKGNISIARFLRDQGVRLTAGHLITVL